MRRLSPFLAGLVLTAAVLAVFLPTLRHGFVFDDFIHIYDNRLLYDPSPAAIAELWKKPYQDLYIPLTYSLWSLQAVFARVPGHPDPGPGAFNPAVFHAANVLVHLLNALLVFSILRRLARGAGGVWPPLAGALLFAVHPLQAEAVAWVSEFKGLAAAFFSLAAIRVSLGAATTEKAEEPPAAKGDDPPWNPRSGTAAPARAGAAVPQSRGSGRQPLGEHGRLEGGLRTLRMTIASLGNYSPRPPEASLSLPLPLWRQGAALALFAAGLLCKPSAVVAPFLLAVLLLADGVRPRSGRMLGVAVWLALLVPFCVMTRSAQVVTDPQFVVPWYARPVVVLDAVWFYLGKLAVPVGLAVDYGRGPWLVVRDPWTILACLGVLGAGYAAWRWRGLLGAPAALFVLGLLPVTGLVPFEHQYISTVADRYAYLAMLGPSLLLSRLAALARPVRGGVAVRLAVAAGLVGLAWMCGRQAATWRDDGTLFAHCLTVNPRSFTAHNNIGSALLGQGRHAEAMTHFEEALKVWPTYYLAQYNMGNALLGLGRAEEAAHCFEKALREWPEFPEGHLSLGLALSAMGRTGEAIPHFKAAQGCRAPEVAWNSLGDAYFATGDFKSAAEACRAALAARPGYAEAHNSLARALWMLGERTEAVEEFREAVRLKPDLEVARANAAKAEALLREERTAGTGN